LTGSCLDIGDIPFQLLSSGIKYVHSRLLILKDARREFMDCDDRPLYKQFTNPVIGDLSFLNLMFTLSFISDIRCHVDKLIGNIVPKFQDVIQPEIAVAAVHVNVLFITDFKSVIV